MRWQQYLGASLLLASLLLAGLIGMRVGRDAERRRPLSSTADIVRAREELTSRTETELRAKLRLPKLHQDPENATRIHLGRLGRKHRTF